MNAAEWGFIGVVAGGVLTPSARSSPRWPLTAAGKGRKADRDTACTLYHREAVEAASAAASILQIASTPTRRPSR